MSTRITIFEGYTMARHKKRRSSGAKKQQSKMKSCASAWKRSGKKGKYTTFMKSCLRK